jgi:hypothetical protein
MVPVAAVLGVSLLATTVWASNAFVSDLFGGAQPETVLPGSAVAFGKVDLKPSGGQLANYAQFVNRLPDSVKDEIDPEADPAQEVVESMIDELGLDMTYEQDFEPWVGRRFGFAAWPAQNPDAAESDGLAVAVALAVEDEDAATAALGEVEDTAGGFVFDLRDGFAILAPNDAALTEALAETDAGALADQETFAQDTADLGGAAAALWMDAGATVDAAAAAGDTSFTDPLGTGEQVEVTGRVTVGLTVEPEYAEVRGSLLGFTANGVSLADYEAPEPGLEHLGDLPNDTVLAVGGNGLDAMLRQAQEDNPEDFAEVESGLGELGVSLPEGWTDLLGTRTAVGVTDYAGLMDGFFGYGSTGDLSMQLRAVGADAALLEDIAAQMATGGYGTAPGVTSEGDTVVVSSGSTGTGRLGDDPMFQRTMQGTETAIAGYYMDLRPVMEQAGEAGPEQWGSLGGSLTLDGADASFQARWAPDGAA